MSKSISNCDDVIDSRDIIERIEELCNERDSFLEEDKINLLPEWDKTPEAEELNSLLALQEECDGYSDWKYGMKFIRYDYFRNYAEDFVYEIGDMPKSLPSYIENNIDWEGVAEELLVDYTSADFDGVEYYFL